MSAALAMWSGEIRGRRILQLPVSALQRFFAATRFLITENKGVFPELSLLDIVGAALIGGKEAEDGRTQTASGLHPDRSAPQAPEDDRSRPFSINDYRVNVERLCKGQSVSDVVSYSYEVFSAIVICLPL